MSAARLWGMPLPLGVDDRVHVAGAADIWRVRRRGIVWHERPAEAARCGPAPVSGPLDTFIEIASMLGLDDLVAVGDWLVLRPRFPSWRDPRPLLTPRELRSRLAGTRAWGIRRAREAADLVREGSESPRETVLRLLIIRAGLPEPELGIEIHDRAGRIGWFDLGWPPLRVAVEYDGDQHRTDSTQYEKDILRFDRATAAGWRVVRVRARGLAPSARPTTLTRIREALAAH